jgi:NTP pyrophosphatase (non-canonical NTP hydrolase)
MKRIKIKKRFVKAARQILKNKLAYRMVQKGPQSYASVHEALGLITEEYKELIDAVQSNNREHVMSELLDVAVGCIWALACNLAGGLDD